MAVIDSGVHVGHPHIGAVAGGISIGGDGVTITPGEFTDTLGHGTAVMAAIQEKAPLAEYFAVKIFHDSLRASARCLLRAIEWSLDEQMDIVNLSLGTNNPRHIEFFEPLILRAAEQGVALVSAKEKDGERHYPGALNGVYGVCLDPDCDRGSCRVERNEGETSYFASGLPRPAPGIPVERNLQGISFAVANVSGWLAAGLLPHHPRGDV